MRYVWMILGVLVIVGGLAAIKAAQIGKLIGFGKEMEAAGPPPEPVGTTAALEQTWEVTISAVGSVASGKGVAISNDSPGVVSKIHFESGKTVKAGEILVELDTSVERAQLASAVARRDLANTTMGRTRALGAQGAISKAQVDADESQLRTSATEVDALQAQIARKQIRAPFAGTLGIRAVNIGQYLGPGTKVTDLESAEATHVDFSLPQQRLADIAIGMPIRITLEGQAGPPLDGRLGAVDPSVDPTTRNIKLRGDVTSNDDALRAGMFVRVAVVLPKQSKVIAVPATAVVHAPYGDSVFVIEDKKPGTPGLAKTADGKTIQVARQQFVKSAGARGDFVGIADGLKGGERVVSSGAFKLRNSAPVVVDDTKAPKPELAPNPENR